MVKYRPHRGALSDAMAEMKTFDSVEDMFRYIVDDWKVWGKPFDIGDLTPIGKKSPASKAVG